MSNSSPISRDAVAIGGASGFIGRALGQALACRFRVIGVSRGAVPTDTDLCEWRNADLTNLIQTEQALWGARYAVYLVHSMMPSDRATRASFADLDLLCADNFSRAAARAGVEQIIYLGGLIPEGKVLSPHLKSRREVEETLACQGVPVTTLRAGLVIGGGGSSFEILAKLVSRLPAMVCPRWTETLMQPIALDDVVNLLSFTVGRAECYGQTFDVGAPEALSYRQLMRMCAELLGVKRPMLPIRLFTPSLSRLWVSLVTGAPRALVGPLVESLRHEMVVRDHRLADMAGLTPMPTRKALALAIDADSTPVRRPARTRGNKVRKATLVQSISRMYLPKNCDAVWAAAEYARWLPLPVRSLVRVETDVLHNIRFFLRFLGTSLLLLQRIAHRCASDRQVFSISGGVLSRSSQGGQFELRQVFDKRTLLIAIHDYRPRLPWLVYICTQALLHSWVMSSFRRHLARIGRDKTVRMVHHDR